MTRVKPNKKRCFGWSTSIVLLLIFHVTQRDFGEWQTKRHLAAGMSAVANKDYPQARKQFASALWYADWFGHSSDKERTYDVIIENNEKQHLESEAAEMVRKRIVDDERNYGENNHAYFADRLNSAGRQLLAYQNGYAPEARALFERALHIREVAFGPASKEVDFNFSEIGHTLVVERNYRQLFILYKEQLEMHERAHGKDAPQDEWVRRQYRWLSERLGGERGLSHPFNFLDFTFPGSKGNFEANEYPCESFTLLGGQSGNDSQGFTLEKVSYDDVNGDGLDDAIVTFGVRTNGSAGVNHVYIFDLHGDEPKFIWGFESGDRAWGGLKDVYGQGGELVVELFGNGTRVGSVMGAADDSTALCCPKSATRTRYKWHKKAFEQDGKPELLPVDTDVATERAKTRS